MNSIIRRVVIWFCLLLLCAVVLLSCVQENAGFDRFHEIACADGPPRLCEPTGRQVALTRKPGDKLSRPPKLATVRIETFSPTQLLESHIDQAYCSMPDAHNFACRQVLGVGGMNGSAEPAPWRQAQGTLFNDAVAGDSILYLNGLQFWRNRLLFGSFER